MSLARLPESGVWSQPRCKMQDEFDKSSQSELLAVAVVTRALFIAVLCRSELCSPLKVSGLCVRRGGREGAEEGREKKKSTTAGLHLRDAEVTISQEKGTRENLLTEIVLLKGDVHTSPRNRTLRNGIIENSNHTGVGGRT